MTTTSTDSTPRSTSKRGVCPAFGRVETWHAPEGGVVNAIYYFADSKSVAQLARFQQHQEAKGPGATLVRRLPHRHQRDHGHIRRRAPARLTIVVTTA
jgi:hypothetical protein